MANYIGLNIWHRVGPVLAGFLVGLLAGAGIATGSGAYVIPAIVAGAVVLVSTLASEES